MITIDGSFGEGGGQIVRTSLGLSLVTGTPVRITKIRAGRKKPGLLRQHLTALRAARDIGAARVTGDDLGSREVTFEPDGVAPGKYYFSVGTAGSATLVLQTVLPALLTARGPSTLTLEGGTHNPFAPPFPFLEKAFLPLVNRMGPKVSVRLERAGFFPVGGGLMQVDVTPAERLRPIELLERGTIRRRTARAIISNLPNHVARRELERVQEKFGWPNGSLKVEEVKNARGPGNVLCIEIESEHLTEVFAGFGKRGTKAEHVADAAIKEAKEYLDSGVPVGPHLADQMMLLLALAGGGSYRTGPPTEHSRTNSEVIRRFLQVNINLKQEADGTCLVEIKGKE